MQGEEVDEVFHEVGAGHDGGLVELLLPEIWRLVHGLHQRVDGVDDSVRQCVVVVTQGGDNRTAQTIADPGNKGHGKQGGQGQEEARLRV